MDLSARIESLELAVVGLARLELGDRPGHPFRGNQHTSGKGVRKSPPRMDPKIRAETSRAMALSHISPATARKVDALDSDKRDAIEKEYTSSHSTVEPTREWVRKTAAKHGVPQVVVKALADTRAYDTDPDSYYANAR